MKVEWKKQQHYNDVIIRVSNHQRLDCLFSRLFKRRSKKTSRFRVTRLCEGNSPVIGEFPTQMASKAVNVSIWWRHNSNNWWKLNAKATKKSVITADVETSFSRANTWMFSWQTCTFSCTVYNMPLADYWIDNHDHWNRKVNAVILTKLALLTALKVYILKIFGEAMKISSKWHHIRFSENDTLTVLPSSGGWGSDSALLTLSVFQ